MTYLAIAQHTSWPVTAAAFSSGSHLPVEIAVPVIVAVVLVKVVTAKMRGRPAFGGEIVVRCSKGHLFRTNWSSLGSLTSVRLGSARFQHCPVGDHWSLVRPVKDSDLTAEDRQMVEQTPLAATGILAGDAGNPPGTVSPD
jgi:hypothetical protein